MRKILLSLCAILLLGSQHVFAQSLVRGKVASIDGEPIVGATVMVQGTQRGTSTNADGSFEISAPANGTLEISFLGFLTANVPIANRTFLDVKLEQDIQQLEDVMVVAFGTATKEAFTGSAAVIKGGELAKRQTSNISKALEGQVAGVQMTSSTGQPGSAGAIRIRGIGSINASSAPLYVVDGMPYDGDLAMLNPSDIESMTVLKDAASNALYGARGANGVITITTKRGRIGDAVINVDAKWGVNSRAVPEYDVMRSPAQYLETWYSARKNYYLSIGQSEASAHANANTYVTHPSGDLGGYHPYTVPSGESLIGTDGKMNPNATLGRKVGNNYLLPDSWSKAAYNNAARQEYNFDVSGATQKVNYYFSAGYLNDKGYVVNSDFERISARLKADYQAKSWLKFSANASYANTFSNNPTFEQTSSVNMFYVTRGIAPIYPLYVRDGDGNIMYDNMGLKIHDYGNRMQGNLDRPYMSMANPISAQALDTDAGNGDFFSGKATAEVSLPAGFKAIVTAGVDVEHERRRIASNPFYGQFASMGGYNEVRSMRDNSVNLQQLLTWSRNFGKHHVDALAGHETYTLKSSGLWASKQKVYNHSVVEVDNAINSPSGGSNTDVYKTEGYLTRVQYDYDHKYFFSASYRRDGSSRFAPNSRWGNFWSVGGSWLMSSENFLRNVSWIDMLKVKVSYGSQGNDGLLLADGTQNYYPYLDNYRLLNNAGELALSLDYMGNRNIKWETNYNFNTGVEFEFFNGRLLGGFEFFTRTAKDLLFFRQIVPHYGFASFPDNIGDMRNTGFEFELRGTPIVTKDFRWTVFVNGTHYKNKITSLPQVTPGEGLVTDNFQLTEGGSMYDYYMREWAGVDPNTGDGLWYMADGTTTNDYEAADLMKVGKSPIPKLYGGFGTTFEFFGIDASINFTYQLGGYALDRAYMILMHGADSRNTGNNWHTDILNAWSPENRNTEVPILKRYSYDGATSSRFLTKASYLNIQNITIGYTLPSNVSKWMGLKRLRVYAVADNVALFTKRKGFDPRGNFTGIGNYGIYAPIRTISGGIQIQF